MYTIKFALNNSEVNFPKMLECFNYGNKLVELIGYNFEIFYNSNKLDFSIFEFWLKKESEKIPDNFSEFLEKFYIFGDDDYCDDFDDNNDDYYFSEYNFDF